MDKEVARIRKAWIQCAEDLAEPGEEIFGKKLDNRQIWKASTSTQLAAKAKPQEERTWDQIVPSQYHKWRKVFSEKEAWCLPQYQPWDISINLIGGNDHILDCKVYPLTSAEQPKLDKHILDAGKGLHPPLKIQDCLPPIRCGKERWQGTPCY